MERSARIDMARRYSRAVKTQYGDRIREIILYGSVSRGEDIEGSDIDLLVVLNDPNTNLQRDLSFLSYDMTKEYGNEVISVQTVTRDEFERYRSFSFYRNVMEDGIRVG